MNADLVHGRDVRSKRRRYSTLKGCGGGPKIKKMFQRRGRFRKLFNSSKLLSNKFKKLFGDACLRQDSIKSLLISCFDLLTGSAFMFSRSDIVESDGFNFHIKDICVATCAADRATEVKSVDRRTWMKAMGGGIGMGNPTAAAITHVLTNKREFPFVDGAEDRLVVSLGSSKTLNLCCGEVKSTAKVARIAGEGTIDAVDQSATKVGGRAEGLHG
ncbi:patatin-like protein 3 [Asparagus officinalis]|uniref:patatin-like protein 3 n=1 Tax=Asparagus officinalis TaxID=4686 RepID=UPI00098E6206|nr:patatin-like protein 3 [Asparagus officinalis]